MLHYHIRDLSYQLWVQAGCPHGEDKYFWQQAEYLLREHHILDILENVSINKCNLCNKSDNKLFHLGFHIICSNCYKKVKTYAKNKNMNEGDVTSMLYNILNSMDRKNLVIRQDSIRIRAYFLWKENKEPDGMSEYFWELAEQQLLEEKNRYLDWNRISSFELEEKKLSSVLR